jgi:hypothetical protein
VIFKRLLVIFIIIPLTGCNTVTGSIEGTALGVVKDVKTPHTTIQRVFLPKLSVVI